jgi:ADP-ribosylglycohydrolase
MAMRLATSLVEVGHVDVDDIGARYLTWWRDGAFDTGPTTARVLALVDRGVPFAEAASIVHREAGGMTAGCNPAHRTPPLAAWARVPDEALAAAATAEAALTHAHPLAGDVAAAAVVLVRRLIRGAAWDDARRAAATGRAEATVAALLADGPPTDRGGFAPLVLAAAVWFVGTAGDGDGALARAIEFAGPANYAPVLVGALAGARWGASAISDLRHVPDRTAVDELASLLAAGWR